MPYKVIGGKPTRIEYSVDDVFAKIKQEEIKFIDLQFTSLPGRFHHTTISANTFTADQMTDGLPKLDGSSIVGFTSIDDSDLYNSISELIKNLKSEEYDGIKAKINQTMIKMVTDTTSALLKLSRKK